MNKEEVFRVLGIPETKDERTIKNAYREKLSVTNPEDDPEGFKRLRAAFEEAVRLSSEEDAQEAEEQVDDTPSGLWLQQAKDIYAHLSRRVDNDAWRRLFQEDIFLSLEEEELCTRKLLIFFMDHFRLPLHVWKVIDDAVHFGANEQELREHFPGDYVSFLVSRLESGEDFEYEYFEGPDDGDYDQFLGCYESCWSALGANRDDEAKQLLEQADGLGISHPVLEICRALYYKHRNELDKASALMDLIVEKYPGKATYLNQAAEYYNSLGEEYMDRSAQIFLMMKKLDDKNYAANLRLTEYYYAKKRYKEAKKCAEKVLSAGAHDEFFDLLAKINEELEAEFEKEWFEKHTWESGLELCWCYLQDGRTTESLLTAEAIETLLPVEKNAEWKGLMSKIKLEASEYEESAERAAIWEEALKEKIPAEEDGEEKTKDLDRLRQTHMIRIQCYHQMGFVKEGYFEKAIQEAEAILVGNSKDINTLLEMGSIYNDMGEYEKAIEIADTLLDHYRVTAAYSLKMEAGRRQLDATLVYQGASNCIHYFPDYTKPYEYLGKVYLDLERPEDMKKLLETAKENGIDSDLLKAYAYLLEHEGISNDELGKRCTAFREDYRKPIEDGKVELYEKGLPIINELVNMSPEAYMFVERAIFHRIGGHFEEAEKDLETAISLNPTNFYALNALSFVYKYQGKIDKAITYLQKALLFKTEKQSPIIYSDLAELYSLAGDYKRALTFALKYQELSNDHARWIENQIAELYINLGQVEEACKIYASYEDKAKRPAMELSVEGSYKCNDEKLTRYHLNRWAEFLEIRELPFDKLKNSLFTSGKTAEEDPKRAKELARYYKQLFFTELVFKHKSAAMVALAKLMNYDIEKDEAGDYSDAVFGCICFNEEKTGLDIALKLKAWLAAYDANPVKSYYGRDKGMLQLRILADWYTKTPEELMEMMDGEKTTQICHFCSSCVCRELECLKVLLYLKLGRRAEAEECMKASLRKMPSDEYMLAVKHNLFS